MKEDLQDKIRPSMVTFLINFMTNNFENIPTEILSEVF